MSKIGQKPITIPDSVQVNIAGSLITVKGPKGEMQFTLPRLIKVEVVEGEIIVTRTNESGPAKAFHGTTRSVVSNLVKGVTDGFTRELELVGTGYRARVSGQKLTLSVGYSHEVDFMVPQGIEVKVEGNLIKLSGIDKHEVGQVAANIRAVKKPEPYKGKGIRYVGEVVRRKAGKAVKAGA